MSTDDRPPLDIVLVDDNDDDVVLLQDAFSTAAEVRIAHVAYDAEGALRYLRREPPFEAVARPGLVLVDINMPRMNGFELLAQLKSDPNLCDLPVVILTTSKRDEDVSRSYQLGACSFVTKPVGLELLRQIAAQISAYWASLRVPANVPPAAVDGWSA